MALTGAGGFGEAVQRSAHLFADNIVSVFFSPGSQFSLLSIGSALVLATIYMVVKRRRPVRFKVLTRALFPRRFLTSASTRADIAFLAFNTLAAGVLFGWAMLSYAVVGKAVAGALTAVLGPMAATSLPIGACVALMTLALYLAYEFAYFGYHYLSHRIPFLWAFHRVHHTAEVLSPLTNFRVHPVDSLVFGNCVALMTGLVGGALTWALGRTVNPFVINGTNVILVGFLFCLVHLQHSHIWISFRGVLGRIIMSPAHHQLHHSSNPAHFGSNFGSCLSVWDWMFGTLRMPGEKAERLTFGAAGPGERPHSVTGGLITPFIESVKPTDEIGGGLFGQPQT